jgi:multidrug efflux system outer membrane protein
MKRVICFGISLLLISSCTVGPNYKSPHVAIPESFRNDISAQATTSSESLGDEKWWEVYQDQELQKLIRKALTENYDVRIAANRILQAQQQAIIVRSNAYPTVGAGPGYLSQELVGFGFNQFQLQGFFSWDVDFWRKFRRADEAVRASLIASEWAQREVVATLVSNVATAYFQLRELDLELDIAKKTLGSRRESLQLTQTLANGGAAGLLDVRQAEQLVETAAETIPETERRIAQQEDLLSTLIGDNPHDIPRGLPLADQAVPTAVPAGLPSALLERRPDIEEKEQQLIVANAQIGIARAQFFPDLPLTATAGTASRALLSLLSGPAAIWNVAPTLTQPIFQGGKLRANLKLTEAQQQQAILTYQQTVQNAFRQVSDALVDFAKYREFREHQESLTTAAREAADLSDVRYRGGAASYLEVLTNETNYFSAQLNLSRAMLNERVSLVQLYSALGGGWE